MNFFKKMSMGALLVGLSVTSNAVLAQTNESVTFPDLKDAYFQTGAWVNVDSLKLIGLGQSYEQVRLLVGNPHFSEGLMYPRVYDYAFNFWTNQPKGEYETCQYQVKFDNDKHLVVGSYWKNPLCERFVKPAH